MLAVLATIACLVLIARAAFRAFRSILGALEELATRAGGVEAKPLAPLRLPGATGDPEAIAQAHRIRQEVADARAYRRGQRLLRAVTRWQELGLIAKESGR